MARSRGHVAVAALLCALGHLFLAQLANVAMPSLPGPGAALPPGSLSPLPRPRVSLSATKADIAAAKQKAQLLMWASNKLALEGSPDAPVMAKADEAVAFLEALKNGDLLPGLATFKVSQTAPTAPAPAAPVAVPVVVSKEEIAAAKRKAQLLTWAADKVAGEGSPNALAIKAKADMATAEFEDLKSRQAAAKTARSPVAAAQASAAPAEAAPAPESPVAASPAAAPVPAAAEAPAPAPAMDTSSADIAEAKQKAQLLTWAAKKLSGEGSPDAAAMQAKAENAVRFLEALKKGEVPPIVEKPADSVPVAAAPTPSPVRSPVSKTDIAEAKQKAQLLTWAAKKLSGEGSPDAAAMQAKAENAVRFLEALKKGEVPPIVEKPADSVPVAAAPTPSPVRSPVSKTDIAEAKKTAELLGWTAKKLAEEGSPAAEAMRTKAELALAELETLKSGEVSPTGFVAVPAQLVPAQQAPANAAPVAASPASALAAAPAPTAPAAVDASAVGTADIANAKQKAQLLTWAANKLASEGSPDAATMQAMADQAVAELEALKDAEASPAATPVALRAASAQPASAAPAAVERAPVATIAAMEAFSRGDLASAKRRAQMLTWTAKKLAREGSPDATSMEVKADLAVAEFEAALEELEALALRHTEAPRAPAEPDRPAPETTAAHAPEVAVAPQPVASAEEIAAAKQKAQLLTWAASRLV
eukprot:CAMPEP_0195154298 /NCGR_PEP_ID=MMETSP0448-20130528/183581_1 /TAXON_ID=66468 /ORGANISM="Heterocapsa triquestra, Strain CCMP 448" /LENGTH=704 /DNA_ID=CAMNT_0040193071 /DNA_START=91 /DNA_END=2202 /DNA_ORIENTATION=+